MRRVLCVVPLNGRWQVRKQDGTVLVDLMDNHKAIEYAELWATGRAYDVWIFSEKGELDSVSPKMA
jgi:hypothetical protein